EFLGSKSQRLSAQRHGSRRRVYGEMSRLIDERYRLEVYARSQRRSRPRQKFPNSDRLANEVVGAKIQCRDLFGFVIARGQSDDRDGRMLAEDANDLAAVDIGQINIQHDQSRLPGNRENNGLAAGTCLRGLIALGDQRLAQYFN